MDAELLSSGVGIALTLAFSYIPGLRAKFESLPAAQKQAVMGGLLVLGAAAVFGAACLGLIDSVACTEAGAVGLARVLLAALVANQSVYHLTKR